MTNEYDAYRRNAAILQKFLHLMQEEIASNSYKGDWRGMTPLRIVYELDHHKAKLVKAMDNASMFKSRQSKLTVDWRIARKQVFEHAADVGCIIAMILCDYADLDELVKPAPEYAKPSMSNLLIQMEQFLSLYFRARWLEANGPDEMNTKEQYEYQRKIFVDLLDQEAMRLLPAVQSRLGDMVIAEEANHGGPQE